MRALLLLVAAPTLLAAQETPARSISLPEAIELAQRNAPQTVQARNAIRQSDLAVRTAWGSFLPTLSLSQGANHSGGKILNPQGQLVPYENARPWSFSRGLSGSLRLFDFNQRYNQLQAARSNANASESNERAQRYTVAQSVSQAYFSALQARESRGAAVTALAEAEQSLRAAVSRIQAGAATRSDSLRAVIQVGNQRLAVLTAETDLENANATLTRLLATPYTVTANPADTSFTDPLDVDTAEVMRSVEGAPSVVSAQATLTANRASARALRAPYFPTLNMSFGMSGNNNAANFDWGQGPYSQSKSYGFSLSFAIFNGFSREENLARAKLTEINAQATLRDARLAVQQSLTQYTGLLRLALARIQIQQASVAAALEDLRVQQQRYQLGASTQLELLTTQSALNSARNQLISARYQARVAKVQIETLLGRDIR